jgi:alginate O-acetyltransferase complex protein AlgJ
MLRRHHMDLVVVLIPSQYRIYGPLLKHPREPFGTDPILEGMESALRASGVPVVNLTPVLTTAARDGLAAHRYIYFRDDTHWNAQGIALAAKAIAPRVRETMAAPHSRPPTGPR